MSSYVVYGDKPFQRGIDNLEKHYMTISVQFIHDIHRKNPVNISELQMQKLKTLSKTLYLLLQNHENLSENYPFSFLLNLVKEKTWTIDYKQGYKICEKLFEVYFSMYKSMYVMPKITFLLFIVKILQIGVKYSQ